MLYSFFLPLASESMCSVSKKRRDRKGRARRKKRKETEVEEGGESESAKGVGEFLPPFFASLFSFSVSASLSLFFPVLLFSMDRVEAVKAQVLAGT